MKRLFLGKNYSLALFVIFCFFFLSAKPISAHLLKSSGEIGATLHIDPDDDPIVGQPASFFFDLRDKTKKFDSQKCLCLASINRSGQEVYSTSLFQNSDPSLTSASFSYTFPEKGVYTIKLSGQPLQDGAFTPFELKYDLRVSREPEKSELNLFQILNKNLLNFGPYIVFVGILITLLFIQLKTKRAKK